MATIINEYELNAKSIISYENTDVRVIHNVNEKQIVEDFYANEEDFESYFVDWKTFDMTTGVVKCIEEYSMSSKNESEVSDDISIGVFNEECFKNKLINYILPFDKFIAQPVEIQMATVYSRKCFNFWHSFVTKNTKILKQTFDFNRDRGSSASHDDSFYFKYKFAKTATLKNNLMHEIKRQKNYDFYCSERRPFHRGPYAKKMFLSNTRRLFRTITIPRTEQENEYIAEPQGFMDSPKDIAKALKELPDATERSSWMNLLERLVNTLNDTNGTANNVILATGIAAKEAHDINETFKTLVDKLPDDEMKGSFMNLLKSMDNSAKSIGKVSKAVDGILKPSSGFKTGIPLIDNAVEDLGDGSIFIFFTTLLMHTRYNNMYTFTSVLACAVLMVMQGRHKGWILSQLAVLMSLFPRTKFGLEKVAKKKVDNDGNELVPDSLFFKNDGKQFWGKTVVSTITDVLEESEFGAIPQMTSDELEGSFSVFTTLFLGYFAKGEKLQDKAMNFFERFKRINGGVVEFGNLVKNMLEWLATQIRDLFSNHKDLPAVRFLKTHNAEYEAFQKEARDFVSGYHKKTIYPSHTNMTELIGLITVGEKLRKLIPRDKFSSETIKYLNEDLGALKIIRTQFERANVTLTGFRQEPACLVFFGGPGVGKSKAVNEAAYAAVARTIPEDKIEDFLRDPSSLIYNRAAENVYWDGYKQYNLVCTFDDFGQAKDVPGQPDNEYMNFIRAANSFEYNLHMASVETKGTTTFQSKYIVASTNSTDLMNAPQSIISSGALWRRMDLTYVVVPREEFCTPETRRLGFMHQVLDKSALPTMEVQAADGSWSTTTNFTTDHQWFYPCNAKGEMVGEKIDFNTLMELWFKVHDRKAAYYAQNLIQFEETFSRYRRIFSLDEDDLELEAVNQSGSFSEGSQDPGFKNFMQGVTGTSVDWEHKDPESKAFWLSFIKRDSFRNWWKDQADLMYSYGPFVDEMDPVLVRERLRDYDIFDLTHVVAMHEMHSKTGMIKTSSLLERGKNFYYRFNTWLCERFPFMAKLEDKAALAVFFSVPVGVTILTGVITAAFKYFGYKVEPQSMNHGAKMKSSKAPAKSYKNGQLKQAVAAAAKAIPQMGSDLNGVNLTKSIVGKSMYDVSVYENGSWKSQGYSLNIQGEYLMMPYHFIGQMAFNILDDPEMANCLVRFSRPSRKGNLISVTYTMADIVAGHMVGKLQEKDLVLVLLPDFPGSKSMLDFVATNEMLSKDASTMEAMLMNHKESMHFTATWRDVPKTITNFEWEIDWSIREYYAYKAPTSTGDCGSVFIKMNSKEAKQKIYGMHVAGDPRAGYGYSSAFTREEIEQDLLLFGLESEIGESQGLSFKPNNVVLIKQLLPSQVPSSSLKSNIIKSQVYECTVPAKTTPAMIRPTKINGVLINPLDIAYKKYDIEHKVFDAHQLEVLRDVSSQYFNYQKQNLNFYLEPKVYSIEEALYGSSEEGGLQGITACTSAGWPENLRAKDKNIKKLLFPRKPECIEYKSALERFTSEIEEQVHLLRNGERPPYFYVDILKVERREIAKYYAGKTRLFSAGPFHLLVLFIRYFGHFDICYKRGKIFNWSAVGVNPYSLDWDVIAKQLSKFDTTGNTMVGAGDYSSFDCTHNSAIHDIIVDHINEFYYPNASESDNTVRKTLFKEISNSRHIVGDLVFQWLGSMPSGNALTIIINNHYNAIAFGYCYYRIIEDNPILEVAFSKDNFCEEVVCMFCGDDNVFSVNQQLRPYFNELTLPNYMSELGLIYTTELKQSALVPFRKLTEVSFLKRTWEWDEYLMRYVAPLDLNVSLEICYWTRSTSDGFKIAADNIICTLNELALHSKEIWDIHAPKIINAAQVHYYDARFSSPLTLSWGKRRKLALSLKEFY